MPSNESQCSVDMSHTARHFDENNDCLKKVWNTTTHLETFLVYVVHGWKGSIKSKWLIELKNSIVDR